MQAGTAPRSHASLPGHAVPHLQADPRIVGVAAAGAFAGGGRDEFSDLHRVLEVEPGTVAAIVGEHHRLAARLVRSWPRSPASMWAHHAC